MGKTTKLQSSSKGRKILSAKRKNKRLVMLRYLRNKRQGDTANTLSTLPSTPPHHANTIVPSDTKTPPQQVYQMDDAITPRITSTASRKSPQAGCSTWHDEIDVLSDESVMDCESQFQSNSTVSGSMPVGRRLFDVDYLFEQIFSSRHTPFDCNITHMEVKSEVRKGLQSIFYLQCKMCGINKQFSTEKTLKEEKQMCANAAITLATVSVGIGYSQCEELIASLEMPFMSAATYQKYHTEVAEVIRSTAWSIMEEAGKEEKQLAIDVGEVNKNNIPYVTVVTDGAWSKRSYNVNYDAKSGVACIIGHRTGKLLYLGIRNKYCCVCARAQSSATSAPTHNCYKNWHGPSTSMESDIIVDGFKQSLSMHGLMYTRMVGDGDSSVHKKLLEAKPYGSILVEKVECRNHLLRNFSKNLRDISGRKRSNSKNVFVPPVLRKNLSDNSQRLRAAITKASLYRRQENKSTAEKISNLTQDILNSPSHVFGEHAKCAEIQYFKCEPKINEKNLVATMSDCGLYQDIQACLHRLVINVPSLLMNMDNNLAEHYNSIVCKFVGGKRVNFSSRGSYQTRCEAAAISFNSRGQFHRAIHKAYTQKSPQNWKKQYVSKIVKRRELWTSKKLQIKQYRSSKIRRRLLALPDENYGPAVSAENDDMPEDVFLDKQNSFLQELQKSSHEIIEIERATVGQSCNQLWKQERSIRITASNFGQIINMRKTTSCANTVKALLYGNFMGNEHTKYGIEHEPFAVQQFERDYNLAVQVCGLFIDSKYGFLAASPDGLVNLDSIIEVKCPSVASKMHPIEAINMKKITFATLNENNELCLRTNHKYYYQVQGQLGITNRLYCYFVVWTPIGMLVQKITRDEQLWTNKMLPILQNFYMKCVLPELVDPRYPRGLAIRNNPR